MLWQKTGGKFHYFLFVLCLGDIISSDNCWTVLSNSWIRSSFFWQAASISTDRIRLPPPDFLGVFDDFSSFPFLSFDDTSTNEDDKPENVVFEDVRWSMFSKSATYSLKISIMYRVNRVDKGLIVDKVFEKNQNQNLRVARLKDGESELKV